MYHYYFYFLKITFMNRYPLSSAVLAPASPITTLQIKNHTIAAILIYRLLTSNPETNMLGKAPMNMIRHHHL